MNDNTELELIGTALQSFDRVAAGLALLEKNYKGVLYEVDTSMGMTHAKAARQAIRGPRYDLEKIRKDAKAPLLSLGKRLDSEAARITNALLELENPIHQQIKYEEDRIEQEKLAAAVAEATRIAQIQKFIDGIRNWPVNAAGKSSALVDQMIQTATDYVIDPAVFEERADEVKGVLMASLAALQGIHITALAQEAEQARIVAERAELARLRSEQVERDRIAQAEQNERNRVAREAQARLDAEAQARRDVEDARLRREREVFEAQQRHARERQAAEDQRIRDENAAIARQQEALRVAALPKPAAKKPKHNPGAEAIVEIIALHYGVSAGEAKRWLHEIDWESAAA